MRVGKTRTFYRAPTHRALEGKREQFIGPILRRLQCNSRGGIARGVRRRLREAKQELAAAYEAKDLTMLDAALAKAQTPQRAFYAGAPLEFMLHVVNLAEVMALHEDLREELRVEASLAEKTGASDLNAVYGAILQELEIAKGLSERLGRTVPSFGAAECVCGLTVGVSEHDHERLASALASADKLGLAAG